MNQDRLTDQQAYLAMFAFLDRQYKLGLEELGSLLSSMSLLPDGSPVDQAFVQEWADAVAAAKQGNVDAQLKIVGP